MVDGGSERGGLSNHTDSFFGPNGGVACFVRPAGEGYAYMYWAISVADDTANGVGRGVSRARGNGAGTMEEVGTAKDGIDALLDKDAASTSRWRTLPWRRRKIESTRTDYVYMQHSEEAEKIGPWPFFFAKATSSS